MLGPGVAWYLGIAGVPLRDRRARRARPPQPADRPALARDHAERRQPRADRVLAPRGQRRRPDLRARRDGGRRLGGRASGSASSSRSTAAGSRSTSTGSRSCADDRRRLALPRSRRSPARSRSRSAARASRAARPAGSRRPASSSPFAGAVVVVLRPALARERARQRLSTAWTWLQSGNFNVGLHVLVDPLSTMMMLIVTGVGGLIVLYSIGYMDGDDEERRYFAYMSLFVFSMLLLVAGRQPAAAARRLGPRRPLAPTC